MKITFLELEGTGRQLGRAHGEALKDSITTLYEKYMDCIVKQAYISTTEEELLGLAMRNYEFARDYAPDLLEEMLGIAEGSGLAVEKIMFLHCLGEGLDLAFPQPANSLLKGPFFASPGCTAFGALGKATSDGHVLVGQNFDLQGDPYDHAVLLKIKKPETTLLLLTLAGVIGCEGLSSHKLAVVVNKLIARDVRAGVPYTFVVRRALEQKNLVEALWQIMTAERAAGTNYLLADSSVIINIETTACYFDVLPMPDNIISHANHYKSSCLKEYDGMDRILADSFVRDAAMYNGIKNSYGQIDVPKAQQLLADHSSGYPYSICNHPAEDVPYYRAHQTIASMICAPADLKAWVCWGNPCQREYEEYSL